MTFTATNLIMACATAAILGGFIATIAFALCVAGKREDER